MLRTFRSFIRHQYTGHYFHHHQPCTKNFRTMSSSCCPDGSWPALTVDTERELCGTVENLESTGLKIYYVPPQQETDTNIAVIVLYDVYGFKGGRIKSCCDQIAKATGFHVVMPDVYGDEKSIADLGGFANPDAQKWLSQFSNEDVGKKLDGVYEFLKGKGAAKFGALGFCWGAYPVFAESASGRIQAGASCHPSLKIGEMFFDHSVTEQAKAVTCPILLCPAGNDPDNVKPNGDVQKLIQEKGISCEITEFPEMQHGWVPRGDATNEAVARDVKKSIEVVCNFFKEKLTNASM